MPHKRGLDLVGDLENRNAEFRIWRTTRLWSPLKLEFRNDSQTISECIKHALGDSDPELIEVETTAAEELIKVLFYLGSKDARKVTVSDRATALKDMAKRDGAAQQRILLKTRGLYDHILVGPEAALPFPGDDELSRRQTKVFVRRGHLHGFWTGRAEPSTRSRFSSPSS